jgi:hypothetical protein
MFLLLVSFVSATATAPDSADVVASWELEDLTDSSANSYTLTVTSGSPNSEQTGIIDNAYSFVSADNDIFRVSTTDFNLNEFSYSLWIKPSVTLNSGTSETRFFALDFMTGFGPPMMMQYDGGNIEFKNYNSGWKTYASGTKDLNSGTWYHLVFTKSTGNEYSIYVDGVLLSQETGITIDYSSTAEDFIDIGGYYGTSSYDGIIDEVLVFDVVLDDDSCSVSSTCGNDIEYLYASGSPGAAQQYDFTGGSTYFDITNTNSINNMTAYFNSTSYSTTNGTINTGIDSEEEFNIIVESNEGHYFNVTRTSYNISNDLAVTFHAFPEIIIHNLYDTQSLTGFNVSYDTTTTDDIAGTAYINLNESKSITIRKANFFPQTLTHDFTDSNDLNKSMYQSEINVSLRQEISNTTISNWELYEDATKIAESTGDSVIKYFSAGTYSNLTIKSKTASFSDRAVDNFTITALDNKTEYIYIFVSDLNITAFSKVTSNPIMNFTINLSSYNHTDSRSLSTTTGTIIIPIILNDTYNVSIDAYGYALFEYYDDIYINESPTYYNFSLYTNSSISFTLKDEETNNLITEALNIVMTGTTTSYSFNTSTGTKYVDEIQDGNYSVKIWNANYDPKYYTITVADRSHQALTAYLSTDYETAIFTFKDAIDSELLEGVFFTQSRVINGTWSVVATKYSDITGRLPTSYVPDTSYKITIVKTGYQSKTFDLDPFLFDAYTVYMDRETSLSDIPENDIAIVIDPTTFYEGINNLTITLISPYGSLSSYWVNVTYPSSYSWQQGNDSQGKVFSFPINITSSNLFEQVKIEYYYETSLGFNKSQTLIYSIVPADAYAGTFIANKINEYGLGLFERITIIVLATIIIAGFVYALAGTAGAIVVALIILGVAQQIGLIPLSALIITFLVGFVIVISAIKGGSV